jgi:carbamate kinase
MATDRRWASSSVDKDLTAALLAGGLGADVLAVGGQAGTVITG